MSTPEQWRAALDALRGEHRQLEGQDGRWCYMCDAVECSVVPAIAILESALTPPPVEDAAVEEALDVTPQYARATLRAALADLSRLRQRPKLSTLKRYKKYLEDELLRKGRSSHTPADCCKRAAEAITDTYALDDSHPYREVVREIRDWLRDGGEQ